MSEETVFDDFKPTMASVQLLPFDEGIELIKGCPNVNHPGLIELLTTRPSKES